MENNTNYNVSELLTPDMKTLLQQPLELDMISERTGPGGRPLSYIEAYAVIDQANRIFGEGVWGFRVSEGPTLREVPIWDSQGTIVKRELFYTSRVAVYLFGQKVFEDVGTNTVSMPKDGTAPSAEAHETSFKGCVSDGLKRALRAFGPQFGNSLYAGDDDGQIVDPSAPACPKHGAGRHVRESNRGDGYFCAHRDSGTESGFCDYTPRVPESAAPATRQDAAAMTAQRPARGQSSAPRAQAATPTAASTPTTYDEEEWGYIHPENAAPAPPPAPPAVNGNHGAAPVSRDDMVNRYVEIGESIGLNRGQIFANFYKKFGKPITQATDEELTRELTDAEAIGA